MSSTKGQRTGSPASPESKAISANSSGLPPDDTDAETAESAASSDSQDGSGHSETEGSAHKITKATKARKGQTSKSTSLWCLKKNLSHGALQQWDIKMCPACKQSLRPIRAKDSKVNEGDSRASSKTDYSSRSNSMSPSPRPPRIRGRRIGPPGYGVPDPDKPYGVDPDVSLPQTETPDVKYYISFLSTQGKEVGRRPYHELLNLQKERDAIVNNNDPIIRIITIVQTNIKPRHRYSPESEFEQIMGEGILRNPKYDVEVVSEDIKIVSRRIIDILKTVATYYPTMRLMEEEVTLKEPYVFAFHNMDRIKSYLQDSTGPHVSDAGTEASCDEETRRHLKILCEAVELKYAANVERELARYAAPVPKATFKMLWLLFKPGATVYCRMPQGCWQAAVVSGMQFNHHKVSKLSSSYELHLWYMNFDGRFLGRVEHIHQIAPFDGEVEITSLTAFPAEYLDSIDGGKMRERLEARGERYYRYLNPNGTQVYYSGESMGLDARQYTGRAIIDISSYFRYGTGGGYSQNVMVMKPEIGVINDGGLIKNNGMRSSHYRPPPPPPPDTSDDESDAIKTQDVNLFAWTGYDGIDPKETASLDLEDRRMGQNKRHRYLLCPQTVIGFMLKSRNWVLLDIECCHEIRNNRAAIDTLVMPDERKLMMKALVYQYTNPAVGENRGSSPWAADFIENKGDGQIFLLHGSPGVGKTYTAECIAESTGRPLLSLTCGDIGIDEEELESRLSKWFRLAEIWGAVMLLDEADVFLERRATSDIARNSLVTVFLRAMEYYRGILFLTTNRVGHFDDAFISRIHVVLRYDNLTNADRERIWNQFFDKLKRERGKSIEISREAKRYVLKDRDMTSIPWNGREIRNMFQTAVALAEYRFVQRETQEDGEKAYLEWEDFEKVCRMTGAFKGYLQSVHQGDDEAQRARNELARNDAFVETSEVDE